jgi:hypothetical protein
VEEKLMRSASGHYIFAGGQLALFVGACALVASATYSPFIYFQF